MKKGQSKTHRSAPSRAKQASTYRPTDITPEQFFQAWSRKEREALIELLIDSLDEIDGDPDREDGGDLEDGADDEPSLGTTEHLRQDDVRLVGRDGWTCPDELEEDTADDEPSLGSAGFFHECNPYFDQRLWSYGRTDDREGDPGCDDLEPSLCGIHADDGPGGGNDHEQDDSDMEPSLGWTAEEAARGRTCAGTVGRCFDLEEDAGDEAESDPAENGIGDFDGLLEQVAGWYPAYGAVGFARAVI
jgi:hypothetical protein